MSPYRVLVVEDDEAIRSGWEMIFSRRGWEVALAGTVAEGLAMLHPPPDFLILDLALPDGGGDAILRRVRERKLKTRVSVMTGSSDPALLAVVRGMNPEALFRKPIDIVDVWREGEKARVG